jgi:hypothetical protein
MNVFDRDKGLISQEVTDFMGRIIFDDEGLITDSAEYLGRATIDLKQANFVYPQNDAEAAKQDIPEPKWHEIFFDSSENAESCGKILCSFSVSKQTVNYPNHDASQIDLGTTIPQSDYTVSIHSLGLRNL